MVCFKAGAVGDTVLEVIIGFLGSKESGIPASLISRVTEDGTAILESYGLPIAECKEGKVVLVELSKAQASTVRKKHLKWLGIIAQDKEVSIEYKNNMKGSK